MSEFLDRLVSAVGDMNAEGKTPTHWLMSPVALDRVRHEASLVRMVPIQGFGQHDEFMGYRIYLDRSLPEGAWSLGTGVAPDTVREDDIRRQLDDLHRHYRAAAEPLIKEMAEIEARKPPRPWVIDESGKLIPA